jgi:hypothetical protein
MAQSAFWRVRDEALRYLRTERSSQLATLEAIFDEIDRCIDVLEKHDGQDTYARICGLTLLKAKNLALASCSLILDGLGQEAGALLRPFIEYTELLTYFRKFPDKTALAPDGDLPRAGERAKAIGGMYKEFREHLNEHAAHSSYSHHSLAHLVELDKQRFRKLQRMVPQVLDKNFRDLAIQVYSLLREAVFSIERIDAQVFQSLGGATDKLHARLIREFKLNAP